MATDQISTTTPEAAQVLVQMHQLLWRASVEAHGRARQNGDVWSVDLAFTLSHLYAQVYDLVPGAYRNLLLDRPQDSGADPVDLLRRAEELRRTAPVHHFPPGTESVLVPLTDTVRDFS
ncbi:MAG: hypothetical protein WBA72_07250 [Ornithinimicrobium sp.]